MCANICIVLQANMELHGKAVQANMELHGRGECLSNMELHGKAEKSDGFMCSQADSV